MQSLWPDLFGGELIQAGRVDMVFKLGGFFESECIGFLIALLFLVFGLVVLVPSGVVKKCLSVLATPAVTVNRRLSLLDCLHLPKIKKIKL